MSAANYRPMIMGTHGVITSGHYLATAAGYRIIQQGGNAFDAAAATGFCLSVLNQHEYSIGGEVPTLVYSAKEKKTYAVSGVGWSPQNLTIDWFKQHQIDLIPGDGYLPACVPAVVGTYALILQRFGTMSLSQVLQPAIDLAENGFPMYDPLCRSVAAQVDKFTTLYPTTGEVYLPSGAAPRIGQIIRNPGLAETFKTICRAEQNLVGKGRIMAIEAGRDAFYKCKIAEKIVKFIQENPVLDASGVSHTGLLSYEDMAGWHASLEEPAAFNYKGLDVYKCPSWTQGPVFLQQLALLEGFDLKAMGLGSADHYHTWIECAKLAFADREAYYGDPAVDQVPLNILVSKAYAAQRRLLVGEQASHELRPGNPGSGLPDFDVADILADNRRALGFAAPEQDRDGKTHKNDTTHLDIIDSEGNMIACTPSGGWIASSPIIRGLGFPLGTRAQMFYLNSKRPNALSPHKRPRATLTPTLVTRDGKPFMAFGMRGGDIQDQVSNQFFINHIDFGLNIQEALDVPIVESEHFPSSFYPRAARPGCINADIRIAPEVIAELQRRGHEVTLIEPHHNTMGIRIDPDSGVRLGGVCSSGDQAYAIGW